MAAESRSRHAHGRSEIWQDQVISRAISREQRRLGARLRALRHERGLSLERAAERIGLHAVHLQRIERGTTNTTFATLVAISVRYQVPLDALFKLPRSAPKASR